MMKPEICLALCPLEDEVLQAGAEEGGGAEGAEHAVHHNEGGEARGYGHENPDEGAHLEHGPYKHHQDVDAVLREGGNVFPDALVRVINLFVIVVGGGEWCLCWCWCLCRCCFFVVVVEEDEDGGKRGGFP